MRQYNPIKVVGSWVTPLGVIDVVDGRIQGDFLQTTRDNKNWERENDGQGNATRSKNPNKGGTVAVTISSSSPTNDKLSRAVESDNLLENVVGILLLKDLSGTTVIEAEGAFLESEPDITKGQTRGDMTWVWQCETIRTFVGGHDSV